MTVEDLIIKTRVVLRDTGRGQAIAVPRHQDDEILRALNATNLALAQVCIGLKKWTTVNKLVKTALASGGVPTDHWMLIGANRTADNAWTPAHTPAQAKAHIGRDHDVIAIVAGAFVGDYETVVYWRKPEEIGATGSGELTDFTLPYYNVLRLLAAHELIAKEKRNAKRRMEHIMRLAQSKLQLLT